MSRVSGHCRILAVPLLLALAIPVFSSAVVSAQQAPVGEDAESGTAAAAVGAPADASDAAAGPVSDASLAALRQTMAEHRLSGRTELALQTAQMIVAATEDQDKHVNLLIETLGTMADLETELGQTAAAEQTLLRLIALIEREHGVFSMDLVEPLTAMAELHSASDRREEAITLLRRARHVTHRQLGILNIDQIELAERLVENYFRMGRISEGSRESRFAYRVNRNEYGGDSAALVPATNALAEWYARIGEFSVARRYLKQSIALMEAEYGPNDPRLVDTLRRIAETYEKEGTYKSEGKKALIRAIEIHESNTETDSVAYASSLTDLADWQFSTMRTRDAMENYQRAWDLLTDNGANRERGNEFFDRPKRLRYVAPIPSAYRIMNVSEAFVDVDLLVNPDGTVEEIEVTDSNVDWRTQGEVRAAMRTARYRPKIFNGEPVQARISTRWTYVVPDNLRRHDLANETSDDSPQDAE